MTAHVKGEDKTIRKHKTLKEIDMKYSHCPICKLNTHFKNGRCVNCGYTIFGGSE